MGDKTKNFGSKVRTYWPVLAGVAGIVAMGATFCYIEHTVIAKWPVVAAAALLSMVLVLVMVRRCGDGWLPFLVRCAAMWFLLTSVISCGVMAMNYHCADSSTLHPENVTVESRHSETRHRTRRVRRNVVRNGEPYKVYFVTVRFDSGVTKQLSVPLDRYNKMRPGSTCTFGMARGLFGWPVIMTGI